MTLLRQAVEAAVPASGQEEQLKEEQALIIEELGRIHDGVLVRYGLLPSEHSVWKQAQNIRMNQRQASRY